MRLWYPCRLYFYPHSLSVLAIYGFKSWYCAIGLWIGRSWLGISKQIRRPLWWYLFLGYFKFNLFWFASFRLTILDCSIWIARKRSSGSTLIRTCTSSFGVMLATTATPCCCSLRCNSGLTVSATCSRRSLGMDFTCKPSKVGQLHCVYWPCHFILPS